MNEANRLMPPTILLLCLCMSIGLHFILPVKSIVPKPWNWSGIIFISMGLWITIWADVIFKKYTTPVKPYELPTHLVHEGPFRFNRNPMYLGMTGLLLGIAVVLGSVTSFTGPVAFWCVIDRCFIPLEEKNMEHVFKDEFDRYKQQVRRWL